MTRFLWILFPVLSVVLYADSEPMPDLAVEAAITKQIVKGLEASFAALPKDEKGIRDAHPKHHGCVKAKFEVLGGLSEDLAQGLFAKEQSYKAWVRYSNGSGKVQPDFIPDGRGMAVKVLGVEGEREELDNEKTSQDFLMINFPQFFVKDGVDYAAFFKDQGAFMASHPEERMIAGRIAMQIVTSPLEARYFSMTPVSLGSRPIKYSARPCIEKQSFIIGDTDLRPLINVLKALKKPDDIKQHVQELLPYSNYLRKALLDQVEKENGCFDFYVQFQEDWRTEPVEDPRKEWKTPFHRVARIQIDAQDNPRLTDEKSLKEADSFCENLALTPWHSLKAHKPLGGIQRMRKDIYQAVSAARHKHNGVELKEPSGDEVF